MKHPFVSIIIPVYNASSWLQECLSSVGRQTFEEQIQISVFDDGSTDNSMEILKDFQESVKEDKRLEFLLSTSRHGCPKGCGYAKNRAIEQSTGLYLCFLDSDDVMSSDRLVTLCEATLTVDKPEETIIGSRFHRNPTDSTKRFTEWANGLFQEQLNLRIYTSNGPTVIMPTWFCHRKVWEKVGGFDENGPGIPEDLIFFYKHLDNEGKLFKVDQDLLMYRYHPKQTTFSVSEDAIWKLRIERFQRLVLPKWQRFTIWNAGKEGRKFYRSSSEENRRKVLAFCDVDIKKIQKAFYTYEESDQLPKPKVPIIHFKEAQPPFVICVKLGLSSGQFEDNLASMNLEEGADYYHFG